MGSPNPTLMPLPLRVLVVEDDRLTSAAIEMLLRHYGFDVELAETVADGRRRLDGGNPDVVVLDLNLPDGTGLDLLEHMRTTARRARVVVLTADMDPVHLRRLKQLRPDRFFRKPLNFLDLLAGVRGQPAVIVSPAGGPPAGLVS